MKRTMSDRGERGREGEKGRGRRGERERERERDLRLTCQLSLHACMSGYDGKNTNKPWGTVRAKFTVKESQTHTITLCIANV